MKLNPCKCDKLPDYIEVRYNGRLYHLLGCVDCKQYNNIIGGLRAEFAIERWNKPNSDGRLNPKQTQFIGYVEKSTLSELALFVNLQERISA